MLISTSAKNPRDYQQMMRGPRFAWWRPVLAVVLTAAFALLLPLLTRLIFKVTGSDAWLSDAISRAYNAMNPAAFAILNLTLAALIPASMLATRLVYGVNPGYLSSVTGRFRWRWLRRCLAIALPLFAIIVVLDFLFEGPQGTKPAHQVVLLLLVVASTPLQAAGEEYLFRGMILQNIGALFRNPRIGLAFGVASSTSLFVAAHGSADPWIDLDLGMTAIACCILTRLTGGLEAAIALHAGNNVIGMVASILYGGWNESFVSATSRGKPLDALLTLLVAGTFLAIVSRQTRVRAVVRSYQPAANPVGGDAVGSRRFMITPRAAIVVAGLLSVGIVAVFIWMVGPFAPPPRALRYADVAASVGIAPDGCLRGFVLDTLPLEIRYYRTRELVDNNVTIKLDERVIEGRHGIFQFPISAQLMKENPRFWVALANGTTIDFRYQFLTATVQARATCAKPDPKTAAVVISEPR